MILHFCVCSLCCQLLRPMFFGQGRIMGSGEGVGASLHARNLTPYINVEFHTGYYTHNTGSCSILITKKKGTN